MKFKINNRRIGPRHPVYIVAEISANHHHDFDQAVKLVEAAKKAGADAVKLQTYTPDTITIDCKSDYFKAGQGTPWKGRFLYDLYGEAFTPWEWQPKLKNIADQIEIDLFSTPFDFTAVDFLEKMDVPAYKIASFEIVDIPLIEKIAKTSKPIIMSTGMTSLSEIEEAVSELQSTGTFKMHQRLPSSFRRHEFGYYSAYGRSLRRNSWFIRPHTWHCSPGSSCITWSLYH